MYYLGHRRFLSSAAQGCIVQDDSRSFLFQHQHSALSKMDMNFSAPIHQDPLLVTDILDEAWASETLPVEDIEVPQSAIGNVEDDDAVATNDEEDDNKWTYLALDEFAPLTSAPAPNPEPVTRQNTSRRSECR